MKKWLILSLIICVTLVTGCGGGSGGVGTAGSAAKLPQMGWWTNNSDHMMVYQMEIKPSGDNYLVTTYRKNFPGVITGDYIAKKSGSNLTVTLLGTDLAMVHDAQVDTLTFDGAKYHRQTPDDAKKLEDLKKQK